MAAAAAGVGLGGKFIRGQRSGTNKRPKKHMRNVQYIVYRNSKWMYVRDTNKTIHNMCVFSACDAFRFSMPFLTNGLIQESLCFDMFGPHCDTSCFLREASLFLFAVISPASCTSWNTLSSWFGQALCRWEHSHSSSSIFKVRTSNVIASRRLLDLAKARFRCFVVWFGSAPFLFRFVPPS